MVDNYIDSKKNKIHRTKFYLLPLFILIVNQSINTSAFSPKHVITDLSAQEDSSQLIIRGFAYIIALAFFFINFKENIHILRTRKLFLIFLLFFISSMYWSGFPVKVFINWGHLVGLMLVVMSARVYFVENTEKIFSTLSVFFFVCVLLSFTFVIVVPSIGINQDGRWQGISGNANSLGVITIISTWAALARMYKKVGKLWVTILMLILSTIVLIGSGSKTSFIVSVFVFLFMHLLVSLESSSTFKRLTVISLWFFLGTIVSTSIVIFAPQLLGMDGVMNALGRNATFSGRTIVWAHAWELFQVKVIHGWGFDSTLSVIRYTGGRLGQFHNGYLDILVRGGTIGLSLVVLMTFTLLKKLFLIKKEGYRTAVIFLSIIVAILIHNISEASLVRGSHMLWIVFMFIYFNYENVKNRSI